VPSIGETRLRARSRHHHRGDPARRCRSLGGLRSAWQLPPRGHSQQRDLPGHSSSPSTGSLHHGNRTGSPW